MATKTYAPEYVRKLRKLALYVTRHSGKMAPTMTADQIATFATITEASSKFDTVDLFTDP